MKPRMQNVTSISYLKYMIASPINIWWALVTGIIVPLIGWYVLPSETIALSKIWFVGIIVALMLLLLVTVAVLFGSWSIYLNEHENIKVSNIVKDSGEHIFLLEGIKNVELGSIFEIYRIRESLESPMGLIEVKHKKENGVIQASPIWIKPIFMGDIESGQLSVENLLVQRTIRRDTLLKWVDDQSERKVEELIRRGR